MPERTSYTQGTPNWADLPTSDQAAAKAFYAGLFGWTYDDQPMGEGQVYSWVGVQRALTPGLEAEVPYTIATVDLAEGARVFARLVGAEPTAPGGAVTATFVDHDGWTELRFRPVEVDA